MPTSLVAHESYGMGAHQGKAAPPNRLVLGDSADVLSALRAELEGRVALVYVDPPFDTGKSFDYLASIPGTEKNGAARIALPAYHDAQGLDAWLTGFLETACGLRDLLAPGGSFYVHLDAHMAHYAKVVLDEVFGVGAFQREIVWRIGWISGFKSRARSWIRNHDTLLFYAKGGRPSTFHKEYVPYPEGYVRRDGSPPRGAGYPLEDVWNASNMDRLDSIQIMSFSGEKVGYPTQKNEALVSRIVRASSDPGDLVLDCFVGSGTTAVACEKLGRRWVASDASPLSIHATRKRLLGLPSVRPFEVLSARPPEVDLRGKRRLTARVESSGRRATIELKSLRLPTRALPQRSRANVKHWSQWIDGWCVDWDHQSGGLLNAQSCLWRAKGRKHLELAAAHTYPRAGRYVALVKAFDVLGGESTVELDIAIE